MSSQPYRFAVLGSPIAHSQSPALHRAAYAVLGLPWSYERREIGTSTLAEFVDGLRAPWRGLSLTMPLKDDISQWLQDRDQTATLTRSVNTVLIDYGDAGRSLTGFNTDVYGMVKALGRFDIAHGSHALIIGGGATARSAVVAAADLGIAHVDIAVRDPLKSTSVRDVAKAAGLTSTVRMLTDIADLAPSLTISTLPGRADPAALLGPARARHTSVLLDVAYDPWPSKLAALWDLSAEDSTVSGLHMLVHQAVAQLRIFLNGDPLRVLPKEEAVTRAMFAAVGLED